MYNRQKCFGLTRAQWINLIRNNICVNKSIFCIVRKNWPYPPTASGSYGREASRRNTGGFLSVKASLQVKLFGILICLISLQFWFLNLKSFSLVLVLELKL